MAGIHLLAGNENYGTKNDVTEKGGGQNTEPQFPNPIAIIKIPITREQK